MELYSRRLDDAIALAAQAFRTRKRKGTGIPYFSHLLQVLVTVQEHGGDEDQQIAAVLHDYLEDIPGVSARALQAQFGERVARLVVGLSDATTQPKPPWEERKRAYLEKLRDEPAELKLISAADKLHNAQSLRRDFALVGEELWSRFSASRTQTLWYYRTVVEALRSGWEHRLVHELYAEVRRLHEAVGEAQPL